MNGSWLATHYWPAACEQGPVRTFWQMFRKSRTSATFFVAFFFQAAYTSTLAFNFKGCLPYIKSGLGTRVLFCL